MPIRKGFIMNKLVNIYDGLSTGYRTVSTASSYIFHPGKLVTGVWHTAMSLSYWFCLALCMIAVVSYMFNSKKYSKLAPFSIFLYVFIQALNKELGI